MEQDISTNLLQKLGLALFAIFLTGATGTFDAFIRATIWVSVCWGMYELGKHKGKEETKRKNETDSVL